jgi:hypothetical protein
MVTDEMAAPERVTENIKLLRRLTLTMPKDRTAKVDMKVEKLLTKHKTAFLLI